MSTGPAKPPALALALALASAPRRELYSLALYRVLEAGILAGLLFSPLSDMLGASGNQSPMLATWVTVFYLVFSLAMLILGRNEQHLLPIVMIGACADIAVASLITYALPEAAPGVAMLLLFNVAAACSLLPLRWGIGVAVAATVAHFAEYLVALLGTNPDRPLAEVVMFCISYLAVGLLAVQIGLRARRSQQLADDRGLEVANLVEVNELIIRRMRTGVLVVDLEGRIRLANEAATGLLGSATEHPDSDTGTLLQNVAPELARRLQRWRNGWQNEEAPLALAPDQPDIQPRFARLLAGSELSLVFLDDATVVSRRAESLTLAALGRFSASLAHEIRNPLAAINYAVQLLEESREFNASDRHLLGIIHQQCQRTNGIVESVLGLARRERAIPEHTDLNAFAQDFVYEYQQSMSIETDSLEAVTGNRPVSALVDPRHLHQVLTVLVHNALNYGRMPGEPARIRLRVFQLDQRAMIDVLDRGPGIPAAVAAQLFRPFFTTSEHGTGLGLYIARELCRANQATLEHVAVPGGGSCFRISMPGPNTLLS
ncbi:integral membrane sensor signal transduction histidine kinase [Pseudoxanthomonas spadix BD-a59]|uniref:histidine kinase n=1 Tax=Pseudoxanthomonas spadix (strain BD-a59) TaxID=1045855 RepID=G7UQ92_PSEUP|nr:ATP-binding protein [Pseudoxanthomonas spadix]AER55704.1 integral membrane sensor signal transduction histidine kinase [Pseudoxanthomonas spadix BD-a59]